MNRSLKNIAVLFVATTLFLSVMGVSFASGDTYDISQDQNETLPEGSDDVIKQANIVINWADAPKYIEETDDLLVDYEIENNGDQTATESYIDLLINGTIEDTHYNITLDPGETYQDTLVYSNVDSDYNQDETIPWKVRLWDYNDNVTGETQVGIPDIVINWVSGPDHIEETDNLTVDYQIENMGNGTGTESFIDLMINGTIEATHFDIELAPGETYQDTLNYSNVDSDYDPDEIIPWKVRLWDFQENMTGETQVGIPDIVINWVDAPEYIEETDNLTVDYEIQNVGNGTGTERFVDLVIDGLYEDTHNDIELAPGETYQDTLIFTDVDANYNPDDIIAWSVELYDHGDTMSGETQVGIPEIVINFVDSPDWIKETDNLTVNFEIQNVGNGTGNESFVDLWIQGIIEDTIEPPELGPGELYQGTLIYTDVDANYNNGDTISWTVELWDYGDNMTGETHVGEPEIVLNSVSGPSQIEETEDLMVDFEIENVGNGTGTESFVDLVINSDFKDTYEDIELAPGETYQNTLVFDNVDANYNDGDTISWSVELWDFGDSMTGSTDVVEPTVDYVVLNPNTDQTASAGGTIDFDAEAYDKSDVLVDDVDSNFTWQNTDGTGLFSETNTGDYDVIATYNGVSSPVTNVTVEPAGVDDVQMSPSTDQTITAGDTVQFSASAYDQYGNMITNDPQDFNWQNADGSGLFDNTDAGDHDVMATYNGVSSPTTTVTVNVAGVDYVEISPSMDQTTNAGVPIQFTASAYDQYGNMITNDPLMFTWQNTDMNGWFNETSTGDYDVMATYNNVSSPTITVTVEAAETAYIEISPQDSTVIAWETQAYTATAYDEFDNEIGNVTQDTAWSDNVDPMDASSWMDNEITVEVGGTWTITGEYQGYEDTATLNVMAIYNFTANIEGEGMITVEVYEDGMWQEIDESPLDEDWGPEPAVEDTEMRLTAEADEGHTFIGWTGEMTSSDAMIEIMMEGDMEITANFEELMAEFEVTNYNVDVNGMEANITADVENIGNEEGTIELMIAGEVFKNITLQAGESQSIQETYEFEEEGEHTIELGDQSETVNVEEESGGIPSFTIALLLIGIVGAVAIYYKVKR